MACALAATLLPRPVQAEDRDSATVGKITLLNRKAVDAYQHLEFETAVKLLNEALEISERAGLMLHPSRARTYMTLGIVTLGGYKQRDQAIKDFRKALQIQPEVRLSPGLANPEIQAAFDEAISSLANGASDELPPEKALVHEPVHVGQMGRPVPITVAPDKDLGASAIVLRFRAGNASVFSDLPMQRSPTGSFEAAIPAAATTGQQVVYFIEARRADGSVIVRRASAADPIVVALVEPAKPAAPVATHAEPKAAAAPKSFYFALLVGSGVGTASGTAEVTRNKISSSGIVWTRAGQLAPEIGYFVTPRLRVGVQARLQWVTGATPFHVLIPDPDGPQRMRRRPHLLALHWRIRGAGQGVLVVSRPGERTSAVRLAVGRIRHDSPRRHQLRGAPIVRRNTPGFRRDLQGHRRGRAGAVRSGGRPSVPRRGRGRPRRRARRVGGGSELYRQRRPERRRRLPALRAPSDGAARGRAHSA